MITVKAYFHIPEEQVLELLLDGEDLDPAQYEILDVGLVGVNFDKVQLEIGLREEKLRE